MNRAGASRPTCHSCESGNPEQPARSSPTLDTRLRGYEKTRRVSEPASTEAQDLSHFVRRPADGVAAMDLVVDGVYCGACIATIEKGLRRQSGVRGARVNLANRRVTVEWNEGALEPPVILERLEAPHAGRGEIARNPTHAERIDAVRRQIDFDHRIEIEHARDRCADFGVRG